MITKSTLSDFLRKNPFPNGWTDGLFYREKMRAIHRVAPPELSSSARILEIGGGRSGLASFLYPDAPVVNVDIDFDLGNQQPAGARSSFVCADARRLPFLDRCFEVVTLFDVLEHISDDRGAAREALRVTQPGGHVLLSTPDAHWHYPYYRFMQPVCPLETDLFEEWGHVRRGYLPRDLTELFGHEADSSATFINPVTAFFHDIAFSRLGARRRKFFYAAAALPTAVAYALHGPCMRGTEAAFAWRR